MRKHRVAWTTDGSGNATAVFPLNFNGEALKAILWNVGTGSAGIDFTLTTSGADVAATIYTGTNVNSSTILQPFKQGVDLTGAAITGWYEHPCLVGELTLTVAQGGASKTGSMTIITE